MSLVIKIVKPEIVTERINGKNGSFESRRQEGWIDLPSGERRRVRIRVPRDHGGYAVGEYNVGPDSFVVSEYGDLGLGSLQLVPVGVRAAAQVVR